MAPSALDGHGWLKGRGRFAWRPYTQMGTEMQPLEAVATEGVRIHLADGRSLIDGVASWWTACHGYNHPHIRQAVQAQLDRMPHVMFGGLTHEPALRLAERLADLLPGDLQHAFFAESGSVSVEVALKMAAQYHLNRGETGRTRFVSFLGGYHGDTLAAMSVCDPEEGMHSLFEGLWPPQHVVPLPDTEAGQAEFSAWMADHGHEVAAVIMEPLVQGAGGFLMHAPEVVAFIKRVCEAHGVLLILDEIAVGFGRVGTLFACEQAHVVPDIICLSKALTGGTLPLSAAVATARVFDAFVSDNPDHALMHGPTYMANPLGCAAALASLDLFESEPRLEQVARIEAQLQAELASLDQVSGVIDVRVKGALGVVQIEKPIDLDALRQAFVAEGVWVRPFRDVVYLMPPFVISEADLAALTGAVQRVVRAR